MPPPDPAIPDSYFVPFFWPDEPDTEVNSTSPNSYLVDRVAYTKANGSPDYDRIQKDLQKYTDKVFAQTASTSVPYVHGPNRGCPRPIVPLTDNKASVVAAIDNMIAYPAMGTFIPTGLVWGWHVLTPTPPFTQGVAAGDYYYSKTIKAMVLLSDGDNSATGASTHNKSPYSAFNYLTHLRLGSTSASTATSQLNAKTTTLCQNVKAAGIRLYTITFGAVATSTETLMRNCATTEDGETLYYKAPTNEELNEVFEEIADSLHEIHLAM